MAQWTLLNPASGLAAPRCLSALALWLLTSRPLHSPRPRCRCSSDRQTRWYEQTKGTEERRGRRRGGSRWRVDDRSSSRRQRQTRLQTAFGVRQAGQPAPPRRSTSCAHLLLLHPTPLARITPLHSTPHFTRAPHSTRWSRASTRVALEWRLDSASSPVCLLAARGAHRRPSPSAPWPLPLLSILLFSFFLSFLFL